MDESHRKKELGVDLRPPFVKGNLFLKIHIDFDGMDNPSLLECLDLPCCKPVLEINSHNSDFKYNLYQYV